MIASDRLSYERGSVAQHGSQARPGQARPGQQAISCFAPASFEHFLKVHSHLVANDSGLTLTTVVLVVVYKAKASQGNTRPMMSLSP